MNSCEARPYVENGRKMILGLENKDGRAGAGGGGGGR